MIWKRKVGGKYKYGINYSWNDGNTQLAIIIFLPFFILSKKIYDDLATDAFYFGRRLQILKFGFRLRKKVHNWKHFLWFCEIGLMPIGLQKLIATREQIIDGRMIING